MKPIYPTRPCALPRRCKSIFSVDPDSGLTPDYYKVWNNTIQNILGHASWFVLSVSSFKFIFPSQVIIANFRYCQNSINMPLEKFINVKMYANVK